MKKLNVLVPSVLALFVASAAHAGATFDTPQGKLNIGGDVEYDLTAQDFGDTNSNNAVSPNSVHDVQKASGRIIFDVNGERVLSNGNFAGFKINPAQMAGSGIQQPELAVVPAWRMRHRQAFADDFVGIDINHHADNLYDFTCILRFAHVILLLVVE